MAKKDKPADLAEPGQENAGDTSEFAVTRDSATRGSFGIKRSCSTNVLLDDRKRLKVMRLFDDIQLDKKRLSEPAQARTAKRVKKSFLPLVAAADDLDVFFSDYQTGLAINRGVAGGVTDAPT